MKVFSKKKIAPLILINWYIVFSFISCSEGKTPIAPSLLNRDSASVMTTFGVSKLISDSGVIKYKVITEEWQVYDRTKPPKQVFTKGLFLERYDKDFNVDFHLTADTAYCYNQNLWELRGRVYINNKEKMTFITDLLFWDMGKHKIYSPQRTKIITPDKEIDADAFESNEQMTQYHLIKSKGNLPFSEN